ncbi:MAG: tRNA (adenine(22)-N(1))-methyltransferase [Bacillota bacterium]
MKLSPRLEAVANMVPSGARLLDVGTDHAYLPIALLQRGVARAAVGADVRPGPLAQARAHAAAAGVLDRLDLRQGDGLRVVAPGEVSVAVLAGMGGRLMLRLLQEAPDVVASLERLILAPNTHAADVRRWVHTQGMEFLAEDLVREGRHLYPILCLVPGGAPAVDGAAVTSAAVAAAQASLSEAEAELGPLLLRQGHPLIPEAARRLAVGARRRLRGLEQGVRQSGAEEQDGDRATAEERERERAAAEERRRLEQWEEVVRCWPKWPI